MDRTREAQASVGDARPRAAAPLVQLEGVEKTYQMGDMEVRALRGVSLTIAEGDFVAIMGSSGSGKSTLMNLLGCLDRPTRGRYVLAGRDVSRLDRDQLAEVRGRTLGFVFQSFNLLARTSAVENVELPLVYAGVPTRERIARSIEALKRVGLSDRLDHHPSQLSGGQQQRVAIARAIVNRPKVILADEPTGNLDSQTSVDVMALFQDLGRSGITVVLVTHEPDIAQYASRVIVVKDGLIQSDTRREPVVATHSADARRSSTGGAA
jgi:putative ABC transport system ATP-binding protein